MSGKINIKRTEYKIESWWGENYICPKCKFPWIWGKFSYCPSCGAKVEWIEDKQ